jgi:NarL family two-component system response regulator LiaR
LTTLTPRQLEVVKLVAKCLSSKEIAKEMHLSEQTVKNHIMGIQTKLSVQGRMAIVITGLKEGWLTLDDLEATKAPKCPRWF